MPKASRESIYSALFAQISAGYAWALASRRMFPVENIETIKQPAFELRQSENEHADQEKGIGLTRWRLKAVAFIYFRVDITPASTVVPATLANTLLDAVELSLRSPAPYEPQTLGGLVTNAFIDGEILIDDGSNDGQGVLAIPITILSGS